MTNSNIAIAILAAGGSSRMNQIKQLLPVGSKTMIETVVDQAEASKADRCILVLGANASTIRAAISTSGTLECIENDIWQKGISTSIHCAIELIQNDKYVDSLLIMLGDQPLITTKFLDEMIECHGKNQTKIIATKYQQELGVPALFPKSYFADLLQLKGDSGARKLLQHTNNVVSISGANTTDVDTKQDYDGLDLGATL